MSCTLTQRFIPGTTPWASNVEHKNSLPPRSFYDTPTGLETTPAGSLLRSEPFANYDLPKGATAVRILYHSKDATGRDVATSGVVLIPAGSPPKDGWPVIGWAHGTAGVARMCAPSLMKDLYYGEEGLFPMLRAGFAVVATDYHGLGSDGEHEYLDKLAQARDVMYSIPAARAAVPTLGAKWVVDGHSQGGLAAWGVAELEAASEDPNFLGAIAVAPANHLERSLDHPNETRGAGFYLAWIAFGIHARMPQFAPADALSTEALKHYASATNDGCFFYGYSLYRHLSSQSMTVPGWTTNPLVQAFLKENEIGDQRFRGPLLVIAGESDGTVPIEGVRETVRQACLLKQNVTFRSYRGLDHDPTMTKSTPDQLSWIAERFKGGVTAGNCQAGP
jgi:pimeloyl-ACP methyl ester carboxylesterase